MVPTIREDPCWLMWERAVILAAGFLVLDRGWRGSVMLMVHSLQHVDAVKVDIPLERC